MKQVFEKGAKIQVVRADIDNGYKVGEIYTVHSYLEHKNAYVVEEGYIVYKDSAWIDADDVVQFVDWHNAPEGATHYNDKDCIYPWLKLDNGVRYYHHTDDNRWVKYTTECYGSEFVCHFDNAIKRPVAEKKEMPDIDWSKAPKGYDYWIVDKDGTMKSMFHRYVENHKDLGESYVDADEDYWRVSSDRIIVHKRPEEQEMNNEWKHGLPPVNTEFEYSFGNGYWFKATCNYVVGSSGVVALCEVMGATIEQYLDAEEWEFRPVKSKEERDKEAAIDEMLKVADPMWESQIKAEDMCKRLYNAGWRKVE